VPVLVKTILIADDEPAIRELVAGIVRSAGFEAICAADGQQAIIVFRSCPDRIDLIVTDLMMPGADGYDVVRLARQIRPEIRIVCMSGHSDAVVPSGVVFLRKPFTSAALSEVISGRFARGSSLLKEGS
jgi:two-component system cell cycle sensor histidine kinase/response regulator CckA